MKTIVCLFILTTMFSNVNAAIGLDTTEINACDLISVENLKSFLAPTNSNIRIQNSSGENNSSCFFQWDDPQVPHAGIMVMVEKNSVFDESPDYFYQKIKEKLEVGETILGQEEKDLFKKFDVNENEFGAYSLIQSRFYWALNNNYMVLLAFNLQLDETKMVIAAKKLATEINKNINSIH